MSRIPSSPPIIAPLAAYEGRPLWSVMIPVYNCSQFLEAVLDSVLMQDPGLDQMQIEVVDDASTDADVEEIVRRVGKGRVGYYRQPQNVGSLHNFATCINRAQGELIHLLHGDDRVRPGFYSKIKSLFSCHSHIGAAFTNYCFIKENGVVDKDYYLAAPEGVLNNWLIRIAETQRIQYVAMVVRREVYEKLGAFYGTTYGEDWEMWVRIAKYYPVAYSPEVLAEYRGHAGSLTWDKAISGSLFKDLLHTMTMIQEHVPEKHKKKVLQKARQHCAHYLIGTAINIWKANTDLKSSQELISQALEFSKDLRSLIRIAKFYGRVCTLRSAKLIKGVNQKAVAAV